MALAKVVLPATFVRRAKRVFGGHAANGFEHELQEKCGVLSPKKSDDPLLRMGREIPVTKLPSNRPEFNLQRIQVDG